MHRRRFGRTLLGLAAASLTDPLAALASRRAEPRVNGERLLRQLEALSEHGRNEEGGVSRVAYSEADREGRAYVLSLMREAGLEVEVDAAANLVGRRPGREAGLRPLAFGSHIDSVPMGGNYDGPVGSLAAIELARTLRERGIATRHPLEVLIFSNEEGGLIGSRSVAGTLPARELELGTASGRTVGEGITFLGGDPARLGEVAREPGSLAAFVELHIEQGGVLEAAGLDIGVVEGIVGIGWWDVAWEGFANHAGTTPMGQRQDALLSAARFVQAVNEAARAAPGRQVATVGRIAAEPGAPNVIAGRVRASLEIRDLEAATIERLHEEIARRSEEIARADGTRVSFQETISLAPAPADPRVQGAVAGAAESLGLSAMGMPSGAGHDAQSMARLGPMGMIFIPSVGGISHAPSEFSRPEDVVAGADVLLRTVLRLDEAR
jgi:beta-ureidopropionase / N-carbamoyl-L-amino-acid hydrolase